MIYKAKSDGLHTYAIFQKGYTYPIFMCNYPMSKTNSSKRLSPLDSKVMDLFNTAEGKHHQCAMDDLYDSATFSR